MPGDGHKKCPAAVAATTGTKKNFDYREDSPPSPNVQEDNPKSSDTGFEWWSREFQRALDILADPIYHGLQIQVTGQAGCGYHPATADPTELECFAREVGLDASYSLVTGNGRVCMPILIDLSPSNGDGNPLKQSSQGRPACPIPTKESTP